MAFIVFERLFFVCLQALHVVQLLVVAAQGEKLFVRAAFDDFSFVEDADFVGVLDGAQTVCDGDGRAGLHQSFERFLHETFRFGVEGRGRFVEDEDGRVFEDGASDADALALSAGETAAPVADHGVVALFGLHDEVMSIGDFGCGDDLVHGGVLHSEGDIVVECVVEEDGFLVDVADERA